MKKQTYIYFVKSNENKGGGDFYTIYKSNEVELDLNPYIVTLMDEDAKQILKENALKIDPTFKPVGGIILSKEDSIDTKKAYKQDDDIEDIKQSLQTLKESLIELTNQVETLENEIDCQSKKYVLTKKG